MSSTGIQPNGAHGSRSGVGERLGSRDDRSAPADLATARAPPVDQRPAAKAPGVKDAHPGTRGRSSGRSPLVLSHAVGAAVARRRGRSGSPPQTGTPPRPGPPGRPPPPPPQHGRAVDRGRGAGRRAQRHRPGVVAREPARDEGHHRRRLPRAGQRVRGRGRRPGRSRTPIRRTSSITSPRGGDHDDRRRGARDRPGRPRPHPAEPRAQPRPVSDHAPIHCFCFAVGVPGAGPVDYTDH